MKPFIKWAGGKRWLTTQPSFEIPEFTGRYIEPFLGGGAIFFFLRPTSAILSDANPRLIETYVAVRDNWRRVEQMLKWFQTRHTVQFYYQERARVRRKPHTRAAQFLYLNRACFNGLYRENLAGVFNVPIGAKERIIFDDEDFEKISAALGSAEIYDSDFEAVIDRAGEDDLVFADPPYTTAHNVNGFVKYNQRIFCWNDQIRLKNAVVRAVGRGARIVLTNANHESIRLLYDDVGEYRPIERVSVMAGKAMHRRRTAEALYVVGN